MPDAVYRQVLDNVVTVLQGLDLTGVDDAEIVVRKLPTDASMVHPGITVSWDDERVDDGDSTEGTNERDMVRYPCVLTMMRGTGRGWGDDVTDVSLWRQTIRRTFHNKRPLTSVSDTGTLTVVCLVTHENPTLPKEYMRNNQISQMTIWACYLEPRS